MARKPAADKSTYLPDEDVILRAKVTRVSEDAHGHEMVTVEVRGYSQAVITLRAEHIEKA